jgi:hypothetical protein
MPEAPLLECNVPLKGSVLKDEYAHYKVRVEGKQSVVKIKLVALHGDPDVSAEPNCARLMLGAHTLVSALCRQRPLSAPGQVKLHVEKERSRRRCGHNILLRRAVCSRFLVYRRARCNASRFFAQGGVERCGHCAGWKHAVAGPEPFEQCDARRG